MSYASALFCQIFSEELRRPGTPRHQIQRAVKRLSPTLRGEKLRIYVESLLDTITVDGESVRPDWRQRVVAEH